VPAAAETAVPSADAHFLQLGAFGSAANAEAALANLRRQLAWLQVPIELQPVGGLYRLQAGPYPGREQALRAGDEVATRIGLRPLLLPR
jgi:rare lipoprotein A